MSRLHFKGGPWTNTEDQFLLAALTKYGLRDWARAASVLQNKTAQQCRERYENYLDERLNLTEEWSLEEEEELLKLQSLFPFKWRTISEQITRRTSTHYHRPPWLCEQHYQKLLDAHEFEKKQAASQQDGEVAMSFGAFMEERRRRRGTQLSHEERAARADTTSTEMEKREAHDLLVSRLANQDQKKGLRKQRKQQQQETSYLAKLENNREAIEAGTLSGRQRKRMRQAMEEDRQGRATVLDRIVEDGDEDDDDDDDDNRLGIDEGEAEVDDESVRAARGRARRGGRDAFVPVDMQADQAKAGIEKRSRKLYGGHLDTFSGSDKIKSSTDDGVRAIQHSLLDRLVDTAASDAGVARLAGKPGALLLTSKGATSRISAAPLVSSSSPSSAITWDALAGPNTDAPDLDALFAALPDAGETALPSSTMASKAKQSRVENVAANTATTTTTTSSEKISVPTHDAAMVEAIFADLPPLDGEASAPATPSAAQARAQTTVKASSGSGLTTPASPALHEAVARVRSPSEYSELAKALVEEAAASPEASAFARHDEVFIRALTEARRMVEEEEQRRRAARVAGSEDAITADVVAQTQRTMAVWQDAGVREQELAAIDSRVTEEVQTAAMRRHAAFTRLAELVAVCFVDHRDAVLAGSRALLVSASSDSARDSEENGDEAYDDEDVARHNAFAMSRKLLHYVAHYWSHQLERRHRQAALLARLREEEVGAMREALDTTATQLSGTLAEERRLQAEYRERQLRSQTKRAQ